MGDRGKSSLALYRKYRSRTLKEVLGQDHVTGILGRALEKGRISHAYLLTGPRGTGKTSVARILAHEINKLPYDESANHLDIIEIDAASNNGVDDIRSLREKARVAPVSANKKIYIIDEVHMLSKPAFNALLKTLEEPPEHVVFIMATTDADKLPSTILSRVQQYFFHPISASVIASHLIDIAKKEGFRLEADAAELIAERSNGGFRDSISLLDQLSTLASDSEPLTKHLVATSLGLANDDLIEQLITGYDNGDNGLILDTLRSLEEQGVAPILTAQQLLANLRGKLVDRPQLVALIRELIEVTRHQHPDLRLISALMSQQVISSRPAASQVVSRPAVVTAPGPVIRSAPIEPVAKSQPPAPKPEPAKDAPTEPEPAPKKPSGPTPESFNWQSFLDEAKQKSIGLFSLLAKCGHSYVDGTLVLYGGTSFTQKKIDNSKNRLIVNEIIQRTYGDNINISITSDKKPPEDEKLAAVAAMMGGGEEVNLEEVS